MGEETGNKSEMPQLPLPQPAVTPEQEPQSLGLFKSFSNIAKFTVFIAFAFYTLGFIIWQSYLGNYGLSSISFLQTEYVSAAFCYSIIFTAFSLPLMFILAHTVMIFTKVEQGMLKRFTVSDTMVAGYLVFGLLIVIFIPGLPEAKVFAHFPLNHIIFMTAAFLLLGIILNKIRPAEKRSPLKLGFYNAAVMDTYLIVIGLIVMFSESEVSKTFIIYSLVVAVLIRFASFKDLHKNIPYSHKICLSFALLLLLLGNIQYFGKYQFQYIPKQVGGGRPEMAYLKFSSLHKELPDSLGLQPAVGLINAKDVYGPVAILLRSENEIIFLNSERSDYTDVTNAVRTTKTNLVLQMTPNNAGLLVTNLVSDITTNVIYRVSRYPAPQIAEQVQANLVDAMIFQR